MKKRIEDSSENEPFLFSPNVVVMLSSYEKSLLMEVTGYRAGKFSDTTQNVKRENLTTFQWEVPNALLIDKRRRKDTLCRT